MNNKDHGNILPERLYIIGYNDENLKLYSTTPIKDRTFIVDSFNEAMPDGVQALSIEPSLAIVSGILKYDLKVIINTKNDEENITICRAVNFSIHQLIESTIDSEKDGLIKQLYTSCRIFVIGSGSFADAYEKIEDESFGCIRYINPSLEFAFDFIDRYPISRFIPRDKILPDTTIENTFDINVIMVGFGELSKDILVSSIANNQLLTHDKNGAIAPKLITYSILGEGLNNGIKDTLPIFRYERELIRYDENGEIIQNSDYLELPPPPATVNFIDTKFDTGAMIGRIRELISDKPSLTLIIIDCGAYKESLDISRAILKSELCRSENITVEVFARGCGAEGDAIIPHSYGNPALIYNADRIINDKIFNMAMERNRIYTLESEYLKDIADGSFDGSFEEIIALADRKWYTSRTAAERKSNIYAVLSIRSKLNLLGLDYAEQNAPTLSAEIYDELYTKGEIKYLADIDVMGRKIPAEMTYDFSTTVRGVLAHQEHYRWNSFMLSQGYIPATINDIVNEKNSSLKYTNGKNNELRRHGNITTANGLIKYRQLLAERDGCDELMKDVICYDYQLMDDALWLIRINGYSLIKKEE